MDRRRRRRRGEGACTIRKQTNRVGRSRAGCARRHHTGRTPVDADSGSEDRFALDRAPDNSTFLFLGDQAGPLALSPDGRKLAFVANPLNDAAKLYIRLLDAADPTALSGTENATSPFWSPDSRDSRFFADGKLKPVGATGGGVITVCDAETDRGGIGGKTGRLCFPRGTATRFIAFRQAAGPQYR